MHMAIFETPNTENYAFGETAEEAALALIKFFQREMQFPEYLAENREGIRIIPAKPGTVAHLGAGDQHWPKGAINGADPSLQPLWVEHFPGIFVDGVEASLLDSIHDAAKSLREAGNNKGCPHKAGTPQYFAYECGREGAVVLSTRGDGQVFAIESLGAGEFAAVVPEDLAAIGDAGTFNSFGGAYCHLQIILGAECVSAMYNGDAVVTRMPYGGELVDGLTWEDENGFLVDIGDIRDLTNIQRASDRFAFTVAPAN